MTQVQTPPQTRRTSADGLRVCQVVGSFRGGGAQGLARNLAEALAATGCETTAVALKPDGLVAFESGVRGVEIASHGRGPRTLAGAIRALRSLVHDRRFAIVHVHGSGCLPVTAAALCGLRERPGLCFTWHDSGSVAAGRGLRPRLTRWGLRRCDLLFGSSRDVARRLRDAVGRRDVRVFRNGVPVRDAPEASGGGTPEIVWMARIDPAKDPLALIRAAARLRDEGIAFHVTILGNALPHRQWLMDQALDLVRRRALEDRITLPGWVDDPSDVLRHADIGVQTSHTEGLSLALLEQMMCGLCVVATDVGDTSVAIEHERTGLLIQPRDEEGLVEALRRLLLDQQLRERMGGAARARAVSEFSIGAMAERAIDAYREVLQRR